MTEKFDSVVPGAQRPSESPLAKVKHVIAVGSGKGGVGKSTSAVNLALALKRLGAKVALLDADIYGPSVPKILGVNESPTQKPGSKVKAPEFHGVACMSMALLGGSTPTIWRGPMASRAVNQFITEVEWGELDYLVIDLPPGTGDIQLTLAQSVKISGALIVMTPQVLACDIAAKGLKMFQQVRVPVLGIVENMAEYTCKHCDHTDHIFSQGGGAKVAKELDVPLLGSLPLDPLLMSDSDAGTPSVIERPDSKTAQKFLEIAKNMVKELRTVQENGAQKSAAQVVNVDLNHKAKIAKIIWNNGHQSVAAFSQLRFLCPCASCVDEGTGKRKIKKEDVDPQVHPLKIETVGNYALKISWSDGHDTGLYSFDYLKREILNEAKG